jgi:hypothetical protein
MRLALAGLLVAGVLMPAVASAQAWSLAYPPLKPGTTTPDPAAPLPEWTLWQLFASESACQEHRALWQMVVKAEDDESIRAAARRTVFAQGIPPPSITIESLEEGARRWVIDTGTKLRKDKGAANQVLSTQCVSSTDPRLQPTKKTP